MALPFDAMDIQTSPIRSDAVVSHRSGEEVVLLDAHSGEYFTLSEVGARIWELCDGRTSVGDIVLLLAKEYDAPSETIHADVIELLNELAAERLVSLD